MEQNSGECVDSTIIMLEFHAAPTIKFMLVVCFVEILPADEILRDAIDSDVAFLVVGDPLGCVL